MTLRHLLLVCGGCRCSRARYCRAAATERAATHSCVLNTVVATLKGDKEWLNGHQCFIVQKKEEGYGWTSAAFGRLCFLLCFPKERSAGMAMPTLLVAVRSKPPSGACTETAPASCLSLCSWVENQDSSNIQTRELGLPLNSPHPEPKSNRQHSEQSIKQFAVFSKFHSSSDTQTKHCLSQLCWRPVALFRRWMSFSPYFLHHARSHVHTVICMLWYWELVCYNAIWAFPSDCLNQNIEIEGCEGSAGALSHPSCSAQTVAEGGWPLHHPGCRMALEYQKLPVYSRRKSSRCIRVEWQKKRIRCVTYVGMKARNWEINLPYPEKRNESMQLYLKMTSERPTCHIK